MAISNNQLGTWANAPGSTKPQYTHEQIRKALSQSDPLKSRNYEVFLQGSYANSTNVKIDSDIDIVVQLNSTFYHDLSRLTEFQKSVFHLTYPNATYHWIDFRADVIQALVDYFGKDRIRLGNKSIKLVGDENLLNADIVACLQHRSYNSFDLSNQNDFVEGMKFLTIRENKEIINYPKIHKLNGESKNTDRRTNEKYKDIVRITKNIKHKLIEDDNLNLDTGPSYFVECAIYNVPDSYFVDDYQVSLEQSLGFILGECDAGSLVTVSHQHLLFGPEEWQWNKNDAGVFFQKVQEFYLNGS